MFEKRYCVFQFGRSQSAAQDPSGGIRKQMFNERHSRDQIENFLKEMKADVTLNNNPLIDKAWQEYRNLMRSEKILAYRHPKQVRTYKEIFLKSLVKH